MNEEKLKSDVKTEKQSRIIRIVSALLVMLAVSIATLSAGGYVGPPREIGQGICCRAHTAESGLKSLGVELGPPALWAIAYGHARLLRFSIWAIVLLGLIVAELKLKRIDWLLLIHATVFFLSLLISVAIPLYLLRSALPYNSHEHLENTVEPEATVDAKTPRATEP